jgi:hypothetical protein
LCVYFIFLSYLFGIALTSRTKGLSLAAIDLAVVELVLNRLIPEEKEWHNKDAMKSWVRGRIGIGLFVCLFACLFVLFFVLWLLLILFFFDLFFFI